jgi:hypothetical protein
MKTPPDDYGEIPEEVFNAIGIGTEKVTGIAYTHRFGSPELEEAASNVTQSDQRMMELMIALDAAGIAYTRHEHKAQKELREKRQVMPELIREMVSIIHLHVGEVSIIYGEVSFMLYELYGGGFDCERFGTPEEVVEALKHIQGDEDVCDKRGETIPQEEWGLDRFKE